MEENEIYKKDYEENEKEAEVSQNSKDCFFFVTVVQTVLCAVLLAVIFFTVKASGENAEKLRQDFLFLQSQSITDENGEELFGQIKALIEKPFSSFQTFSFETAENTKTEGTNPAVYAEEERTEKNTTEKDTAESTQIPESLGEDSTQSMGGEDIELFKAAENTSFAPVETTCAIVAPVDSQKYTSQFGYRINPITNEKSFHTGLDIAAPMGSKIRAAYSGTVRKTGEDSRSGKYIILAHNDGFETFYCHCSEILAKQGAVIRQGETIALVGSTGWSTGPHLHFEVRKNGTRLNPIYLLSEDDS